LENVKRKIAGIYMSTPDPDIEQILFEKSITIQQLKKHGFSLEVYNVGEFQAINWLNTPGPIYTTTTDNCGTGQIEALNNVGGDGNYHEAIFKPPFTHSELKATLGAAALDPFGAYYFDGNEWWNENNVTAWWNKSEERLHYIIDRYRDELYLPAKPHITTWKIGSKIFSGQLFGPPRPIPENYKYWLDFYQFNMKTYLEWYIFKIHGQKLILPLLDFDWSKRKVLDALFRLKNPS
jgi:hypothetical protein